MHLFLLARFNARTFRSPDAGINNLVRVVSDSSDIKTSTDKCVAELMCYFMSFINGKVAIQEPHFCSTIGEVAGTKIKFRRVHKVKSFNPHDYAVCIGADPKAVVLLI